MSEYPAVFRFIPFERKFDYTRLGWVVHSGDKNNGFLVWWSLDWGEPKEPAQ